MYSSLPFLPRGHICHCCLRLSRFRTERPSCEFGGKRRSFEDNPTSKGHRDKRTKKDVLQARVTLWIAVFYCSFTLTLCQRSKTAESLSLHVTATLVCQYDCQQSVSRTRVTCTTGNFCVLRRLSPCLELAEHSGS